MVGYMVVGFKVRLVIFKVLRVFTNYKTCLFSALIYSNVILFNKGRVVVILGLVESLGVFCGVCTFEGLF